MRGIIFFLVSIGILLSLPLLVQGQYGGGGSCFCATGQSQFGAACGNCGTLRSDCDGCNWGAWYCWNEGVCSPSSTQCAGTRFQTCTGACQWQNTGTDADSDGTDRQCGDSICDHEPSYVNATRLSSESQGCVGPGCAFCQDGADNDCDLTYDCADTNCQSGTLSGTVYDQDDDPLESATIDLYNTSLVLKQTTTSNAGGSYSFANLCGVYTAVSSKDSYLPDTQSVLVPSLSSQSKDFQLAYSQTCESDCTHISDNLIHAACSQINGCTFYDSIAALACNNAQPGWFRDYNTTHFVRCASSSPQEKILLPASVSCERENLIKASKIVHFQGKLVRLTVATCG